MVYSHVKKWIKSVLMWGGWDLLGGFQLWVCTFYRCLPSQCPHWLEKRLTEVCLAVSKPLVTSSTQDVWNIYIKIGIADSFYYPNTLHSLMWSHWTTLVHLGTKADRERLLASGRDVSRWLSDVGIWSPSVHQETIMSGRLIISLHLSFFYLPQMYSLILPSNRFHKSTKNP